MQVPSFNVAGRDLVLPQLNVPHFDDSPWDVRMNSSFCFLGKRYSEWLLIEVLWLWRVIVENGKKKKNVENSDVSHDL